MGLHQRSHPNKSTLLSIFPSGETIRRSDVDVPTETSTAISINRHFFSRRWKHSLYCLILLVVVSANAIWTLLPPIISLYDGKSQTVLQQGLKQHATNTVSNNNDTTKNSMIMMPVPSQYYKTVYYTPKHISQGFGSYFDELGYRYVGNWTSSLLSQHDDDHPVPPHIIWRITAKDKTEYLNSSFTRLEKWQRLGYLPNYEFYNNKGSNIKYMKLYSKRTGHSIEYIPRTYRLYNFKERNEILQILEQELKSTNEQRQVSHPWILKHGTKPLGNGITMMGPNSPELQNFYNLLSIYHNHNNTGDGEDTMSAMAYAASSSSPMSRIFQTNDIRTFQYTLQQYVCNLLTYDGGRKADVRVYWLVASIDPLLILLHTDGIFRVNPHQYNNTYFDSESFRKHMTHSGHGGEVLSWDALDKVLNEHYQDTETGNKNDDGDDLLNILNATDTDAHNNNGYSPLLNHITNTMKHILGQIIDAFHDTAFKSINKNKQLSSDNGFQLFGADFAIDEDLDVWFIEVQAVPSFGSAAISSNHSSHFANISKQVIQSTLRIVDEIQHKQTNHGRYAQIWPLEHIGTYDPVPIYIN